MAAAAAKSSFGTAESRKLRTWPAVPSRSGLLQHMGACQRRAQLGLESRRKRVAATRQRPDDHTVGSVEGGLTVAENAIGGVPQSARDTVPLHRCPHRFGHDQTYLRADDILVADRVAPGVHNQIRLRRPDTLPHRDTEIRGPCHSVLGRKHRRRPCVESRSERATTLAAACRDDRATRARPHPQPESVHTGPAAVVRLKSPLALGHGCLSSFGLAPTPSTVMHVMTAEDASTVGKLIDLAYLAKAPPRIASRA